jgi:DNA-binding transcriptional MerR regulator
MPKHHHLVFPILRFETATSYVSRLTRYCGLTSPSDLCLDFGFRLQDFVRGDDFLFEKLAEIGGASAEDMKRWAVRTTGRHQYEVSGQRAAKGSLVRTRLRICPKCLVTDRQEWGRYGAYRRHLWHFKSIRSCIVHGMPLMTLPSEKYTIQNYDFTGQVEKNWAMIERASVAQYDHQATEFERYIADRLDSVVQNTFLDAMPMFIATRLCEMLGLVLINGPNQKGSKASERDMALAGQAGFNALRSGEDGLYEALDTLVTPMALRTVRHQSDLGPFFEWLTLATMSPEIERLKGKVRAYLFRTYPYSEGDMVLGKPCPVASTFTINGAWQTLGIQRKRMNRFLIEGGLAHLDEADDCVRLKDSLGIDDLDRISRKMTNRLNSFEARELLNVSAEMLQLLRDAGILVPKTDALDQIPKYEKSDIERLLSRLTSQVSKQGNPNNDMVAIVDASRRVRCPGSDVVQLIFERKLQTVWRDESVTGLSGFKVNLPELRRALPTFEMVGITKGEASRLLRVTYPTINYLVAEGLLTTEYVRNPKSRQFVYAVPDDRIAEFQAGYETLGQLAKRYRRASGPLGCHLEAKGICPIETPPGISWIYERKGLERRLQKAGLKAPSEKEKP